MLGVMHKSNLYTALPDPLLGSGIIRNGLYMATMEDERDVFRPPSRSLWAPTRWNSSDRYVDTFVREYTMSVPHMVAKFWGYRRFKGGPNPLQER